MITELHGLVKALRMGLDPSPPTCPQYPLQDPETVVTPDWGRTPPEKCLGFSF